MSPGHGAGASFQVHIQSRLVFQEGPHHRQHQDAAYHPEEVRDIEGRKPSVSHEKYAYDDRPETVHNAFTRMNRENIYNRAFAG